MDIKLQQGVCLLQLGKMVWLGWELDLAVAPEVAVNPFVPHQALDAINRTIVGVVERARLFQPKLPRDAAEIMRQSVVAVAAVAARSLTRHATCREDDHRG